MNFNLLDYFTAAETVPQIVKRAGRLPVHCGFNIASVSTLSEVLMALKNKYSDRRYSSLRIADGYILTRIS